MVDIETRLNKSMYSEYYLLYILLRDIPFMIIEVEEGMVII